MKKIKISLFVIFFLISMPDAKTQDINFSKNSIFVELLGNGGLYSLNYETKLSAKLNGRIGFASFSSFGFWGPQTRFTTFPILITYVSGKGKNHFEIGGGMLFGAQNENETSTAIIDITSFVGYRYQAPGKGFLFRIGLTPFLSLDRKSNYPDDGFMLSGGISFGYHF